jgi:hypothetical protein
MADSSIAVTPGTGTTVPVDTFTQASGDHRQAVVIGDAAAAATARVNTSGDQVVSMTSPNGLAAGLFATVSAYGYLRTAQEPSMVFTEPFDGVVLDTTNRWNAATGTVSQANGAAAIGSTAISTVHALTSRPTFPPFGLNFVASAWVATLEASPLTSNVSKFMGFGVHTGTPSVGVPVTDGVGFEYPGDGTMRAVVWQAGIRSGSSVLITASATAGPTRYAILMRPDLAIFYISTTEVPVASISFVTPNTQALPFRFQQVNGATVTGTPSMSIGAAAVHDTGKNNIQISDGTYPWRKSTVDAYGNQNVKLAPAGTGSIASAAVTTATSVVSAANANRLWGSVTNSGGTPVYLALAATATLTAYTLVLQPGDYYELPNDITYTGPISALTATGSGSLSITTVGA